MLERVKAKRLFVLAYNEWTPQAGEAKKKTKKKERAKGEYKYEKSKAKLY